MEQDYDNLYRLLMVEYKDFVEHHNSSQNMKEDLEGNVKGLQVCILDLEAQIMDLKAMNPKEKWKLVKDCLGGKHAPS